RFGQGTQVNPLVFVGRSSFPGRQNFFAASRLPPATLQDALALLQLPGPVPDFHWWMRRLGIQSPWPGNAVRRAGLGAEECSLARRVQWLRAALPLGLTVHGDAAWRELLPELEDLRPPVDYYATLPKLYAQARYSLNVTSLLLPSGLTQRHFDVWIAGGFLLTDATPGLEIFPAELWRETALPHPCRLEEAIARFENDAALRAHIQHAWKSCLLERHTYRHRIQYLCERLCYTK
ncbi:MAG: glycosyltransferase, partial [Betaproteobacteria bacterium]|nr:glycosyltransferase [Betaproteobacteria bacterium]